MDNTALQRKDLIDIRHVKVNKTLPREERIIEYVRQIKNPYRFRYKQYTVRTSYAPNGPSLEECLRALI